MEENKTPFVYGKTVSLFSFTNRENESKKLESNLLNNINTMIISPRRWGKSSLVEKVVNTIESKTLNTVIIDLFSIGSEEEFLEVFAKEVIKKSSNKWEDWVNSVKLYFKQLVPKLTLGIDPTTDFNISFDWSDLKKNAQEILNLPEVIASEKGIKFVICIDEFQNLATFDSFEIFEKKIRSIWQRQKNVTYCLYGSNRHMMSEIFNDSSKPFYRFGDLMFLPKIKEEKWVDFIVESFTKTNKEIQEDQARYIAKLMKNHSWYVQQLSHYVWVRTYKSVTEEIVTNAIEELINSNSPYYLNVIELLSSTQINFLKAVCANESQMTSVKVMQKYSLGTSNNVIKNRDILIKRDLIEFESGKYEWMDPAFELWFRNLFQID
jgi:hypothetical protein